MDAKYEPSLGRNSVEPIYQQLARIVAGRIARREFASTGALPCERGLMRQYSVSRNTVRGALDLLERQGLISRIPRRGAYVSMDTSPRKNRLATSNVFLLQLLGSAGNDRAGTDGFYGQIHRGVDRMARLLGFSTRLQRIYSPIHVPLAQYQPPSNAEICGAILVGTFDERYLDMFRSERIPVVVVDYRTHDPDVDCVTVDVESEAYQVVDYLGSLGHTSLGFIAAARGAGVRQHAGEMMSYDPDVWRLLDNLRGAAQRRGVQLRDEWIVPVYDRDKGMAPAIRHFLSLDSCPTSLVAFDQAVAEPVLQLLGQGGRRCPDDISVVTRSGDDACVMNGVAVTYLRCNPVLMGESAVRLLAARIRGERSHAVRLEIASRLVRGATVGPAPTKP